MTAASAAEVTHGSAYYPSTILSIRPTVLLSVATVLYVTYASTLQTRPPSSVSTSLFIVSTFLDQLDFSYVQVEDSLGWHPDNQSTRRRK